MTNFTSIALDIVTADRQTGIWLDQPESTGDRVYAADWEKIEDTELARYDVYDVEVADETGYVTGYELRAIIIRWVD